MRSILPLVLLISGGALFTSALRAQQECFLMFYTCNGVTYSESCPCDCADAEDDTCTDSGPIFGMCTDCDLDIDG
jgi:hypothetical protein